MGAWIEISEGKVVDKTGQVAPLVGAWIEISEGKVFDKTGQVAPLVGAWIEILFNWFNTWDS